MEKKATAASELSDVYEDMLDIDDDISLSDTFVEDTENLELLKEAAEGTEEAYDELQRNAAEDILIQAKLDDSQIMSAMDDIAYVQDNKKKRSKVFSEIFVLKSITMIISMICFYFLFCLNGQYVTYFKIFSFQFLPLLL